MKPSMKTKTLKSNPNDSQIITPRRVYKCGNEGKLMMRDEVWKDHAGIYHCGYCACPVTDVTLTTTGHDFMEVMGI